MMREIIFRQGLEDYPCPSLKRAGKQQQPLAISLFSSETDRRTVSGYWLYE